MCAGIYCKRFYPKIIEYFSYLTNNVREIENRAWRPFFNAVGCIAEVIWSLIALAFIHWSLLIVGIVCAIIMLLVPKLFEKKMQARGVAAQKRVTQFNKRA